MADLFTTAPAGAISGITGLMKNLYGDMIALTPETVEFTKFFKSVTKPVDAKGNSWIEAIQMSVGGGGSFHLDYEDMETPTFTAPVQGSISPMICSDTFSVTKHAIDRAKTDAAAFASLGRMTVEDAQLRHGRRIERSLCSNGTGILAKVHALNSAWDGTSQIIELDDGTADTSGVILTDEEQPNAIYFNDGDLVDVFHTVGNSETAHATGKVATGGVSGDRKMITCDLANMTVISGDYLYAHNSRVTGPAYREPYGIDNIVGDSGTMLVSRTTYPMNKSKVLAAGTSLTAVSNALLLRLVNLIRFQNNREAPTHLIYNSCMEEGIVDAIMSMGSATMGFFHEPRGANTEGGVGGDLKWRFPGIAPLPMQGFDFLRPNNIWAINPKYLRINNLGPTQFVDEDQSVVGIPAQRQGNTQVYYGAITTSYNAFTPKSKAHGKLTYVSGSPLF